MKNKKDRKYQMPSFLNRFKPVNQQVYERWLSRKARTHFNRDKRRSRLIYPTCQEYKRAIHKAVYDSNGRDAYAGKEMRWDLISTFNDTAAQLANREYVAGFADLPSVDHDTDAKGQSSFKICAWKVNNAKNDLTLDEFYKLCKDIIRFYGKSKN